MRNSLYKKLKITYIRTCILVAVVAAFFLPSKTQFRHTGENLFDVYLNGELVGQAGNRQVAEDCLMHARKNIAAAREEMIFMDPELTLQGKEVLVGEVSTEKEIISKMESILVRDEQEIEMQRAYTVKIKKFTVNLGSIEEVQQLLQAAVSKYDSTDSYGVELVQDTDRELNVLTTNVYSEKQAKEEELEEEKRKAEKEIDIGESTKSAKNDMTGMSEKERREAVEKARHCPKCGEEYDIDVLYHGMEHVCDEPKTGK